MAFGYENTFEGTRKTVSPFDHSVPASKRAGENREYLDIEKYAGRFGTVGFDPFKIPEIKRKKRYEPVFAKEKAEAG